MEYGNGATRLCSQCIASRNKSEKYKEISKRKLKYVVTDWKKVEIQKGIQIGNHCKARNMRTQQKKTLERTGLGWDATWLSCE